MEDFMYLVSALLFFAGGAAFFAVAYWDRRKERRQAEASERAALQSMFQTALQSLSEGLGRVEMGLRPLDALSSQVGDLQSVLSDKQRRGAFGETQLREIVLAALPESLARFQASLSNGRRADCLLRLEYPPGPIAIDSKFPLEAFRALHAAKEERGRQEALSRMRGDLRKHIGDIKERYILHGETAEMALMFVPSEPVYAEIHASLPEIVKASHEARVWMVSPSTLMALLMTIRAVLRDIRMAEKADEIRGEVRRLCVDVEKMVAAAAKLDGHFGKAREAIDEIVKRGALMTRRAARMGGIEEDEMEESEGGGS